MGVRRQPLPKRISTQRRQNPEIIGNLDVSKQGSFVGGLVAEVGTDHHSLLGLFFSFNQAILSVCQHCSGHLGTAESKRKPQLLMEEES